MRKQKYRYLILSDALWLIEHRIFHGQVLEVLTNLWRTAFRRGEMFQAHRMVNNYEHGRMAERERIKRLAVLTNVKDGSADAPARPCYILPVTTFGKLHEVHKDKG